MSYFTWDGCIISDKTKVIAKVFCFFSHASLFVWALVVFALFLEFLLPLVSSWSSNIRGCPCKNHEQDLGESEKQELGARRSKEITAWNQENDGAYSMCIHG